MKKSTLISLSFIAIVYFLISSANRSFNTFNWTDNSLFGFGISIFGAVMIGLILRVGEE